MTAERSHKNPHRIRSQIARAKNRNWFAQASSNRRPIQPGQIIGGKEHLPCSGPQHVAARPAGPIQAKRISRSPSRSRRPMRLVSSGCRTALPLGWVGTSCAWGAYVTRRDDYEQYPVSQAISYCRVLMIEHRGEVDGGRVTADADRVECARWCRGENHETQRKRRKAPDQAQCQFSAISHVSGSPKHPGVAR